MKRIILGLILVCLTIPATPQTIYKDVNKGTWEVLVNEKEGSPGYVTREFEEDYTLDDSDQVCGLVEGTGYSVGVSRYIASIGDPEAGRRSTWHTKRAAEKWVESICNEPVLNANPK